MESLKEMFQSLPIEDRIGIYNRYCERNGYSEIMLPYNGKETLNEVFEGLQPFTIAIALRHCVEYVGTKGWYYFDELGFMWIIDTPYLLNDLDVRNLTWEDCVGYFDDEIIQKLT